MNEAVQDPNSFETPLDTDQAVEQAMRTIAFALEKSVRSVASDLIVQSWRRSAKRVADLPQANALLQETLTSQQSSVVVTKRLTDFARLRGFSISISAILKEPLYCGNNCAATQIPRFAIAPKA
jgi:hypothetical protein